MTWRSLVRLLPGVGGFFYLSFPGKQVYWMVSENGRVGAMKQKKEREKEISQWPWISMLPFGILAGYWGDKEVRITAISEYGFQTRLAAPATVEQKNAPWELAFYDQKTASYQRILLRDATFLQEKEEDFDVVYTFTTEQEDYRNAVQHLALQYSQYIRWKMEDDDAAKELKIVVRAGAGYDNVDLDAATAHNVCVMNTPGAELQRCGRTGFRAYGNGCPQSVQRYFRYGVERQEAGHSCLR